MNETCQTCRFFVKQHEGHTYGDCHRMPPQFTFSAHFTEKGYESRRFSVDVTRHASAVWPNVFGEEWCGEHRQHSPAKDD